MDNKTENKVNGLLIFGKILGSFGIIFGTIIVFFCIMLLTGFTASNVNWNLTLNNICFILLPLTLILLIWIKKTRKIMGILAIIISLVSIGNAVYYENFSMKIEPLIHLHNKYDIPYSDMEIIKTTKYNYVFLGEDTPRSATIKYDEYNIYVYATGNKWIDDYKEVKK